MTIYEACTLCGFGRNRHSALGHGSPMYPNTGRNLKAFLGSHLYEERCLEEIRRDAQWPLFTETPDYHVAAVRRAKLCFCHECFRKRTICGCDACDLQRMRLLAEQRVREGDESAVDEFLELDRHQLP